MSPTLDQPAALPAGTASADPLAQLRGIHLPDPVGFWPPAPGWWILAAVLAASAVVVLAWARRRRRSSARVALRELDRLAAGDPLDLQALATAVSTLLRRVALVRFGRLRIAALHGAAWQEFLTATGPRSRGAALAGDAGRLLALAPYAPAGAACLTVQDSTLDRDGLIAAARAWLKENA